VTRSIEWIRRFPYVMNPGLHCLHEAGWVYGNFSPGNIIVVEMEAKISDLEFAKRRAAHELEALTRPGDSSSPVAGEVRTVGPFCEFRELN